MVSGLMPNVTNRHAKDPDELDDDKRWWYCPDCGSYWKRHHSETKYKFCANCDFRHAVHVEMKPVGKDTEAVTR